MPPQFPQVPGARVIATDLAAEPSAGLAALLSAAASVSADAGLVNNAGITQRSRLLEASVADLLKVYEVNVAGSLLGIQALAPLMGSGSSIVNVGSV